jgi:hypothetical protein
MKVRALILCAVSERREYIIISRTIQFKYILFNIIFQYKINALFYYTFEI